MNLQSLRHRNSLLLRFLAASTVLAGLLPAANANLPYASGDLLLGFHAPADPGSTQNFVVNLGPASQFTSATQAFVVPAIGNLAADLAIYSEQGGEAWSDRSDLYWGIIGTDLAGDPANTLYVSRPRSDANTPSAAWPRRSFSTQSATNSTIRALVSGYKLSDANATSPKGTKQSSSAINSYGSFTAAGNDFGAYAEIEGNFGSGTAGSVLDLYRLTPTSQNAAGPGRILIGQFQLDNNGALTFTPSLPMAPNFTFSPNSYSVDEDGVSVALKVVRGAVTTGATSVQLSTSNDTALAGTDYTAQTNITVNFADGQTEATVPVPVIDRPNVQPNRTFTATLASPASGTIELPASATITIVDTSPAEFGAISFSAASFSTTPLNSGGTPASVVVAVNRTGPDGTVSATLGATSTLASGTEFTVSTTNVEFAPGELTKNVTVQLGVIAASKLPATINLTLTNPQGGATLGATASTTINVTAPDAVKPTLKITTKPGTVTSGTFQIAGTAKDNADISRVEVRVNGGAAQLATLGALTNGSRSVSLAGLALENGKNTIVITAFDTSGNAVAKNVTLKVKFNNSRPALAGSYHGLLTAVAAPTNDTTGFVKATVSAVGVVTGQVTIGKAVLPIRGLLDNAGVMHFDVTGDTTAAPTSLALSKTIAGVPSNYGTLELATAAGGKISGTLKNATPAVIANVDTDRAAFDGKTVATSVPAQYLVNGGKYTVLFPARAVQPGLAPADFPSGHGIGTLTIKKNGTVALIGTLADGAPVSASYPLSAALKWPFFAKLYASGGVITGPVQLDNTQADRDLKGADLLWLRPLNNAAKHYVNGWPAGIKVDLLGASYTSVPPLPGLDGPDLQNGNATLTFSGGKIVTPPTITRTVSIAANGKATNAPANPDFNLVLVLPTGKFNGKFTHQDNTKPKYFGVVYRKGANPGGYGYFLSTVPAGGAPGEGGAVILTAK